MSNFNEIIYSCHYPADVLASAGTGKTELITRKVSHLIINEGVDIDKIALITFTNKATAETTVRLKNKLYNAWKDGNDRIRKQIDKFSMSKISTIHVFCDNIIRQYSYEIGLCPNYKISNLTLEKDRLANEIVKDNYDEKIFEQIPMYKIVKLLIDLEEKASDKGIDVVLKKYKTLTLWDYLRNYFYKIYPIYKSKLEELKLELGIITTNDLIKFAVEILRNKKIAPHIINTIEYLFLDEAQDINFEQATLMELLIDYGVKVFVVGDEKQSIYGFRGSDKNAFNHLISYISAHNGKHYTLEVNFRSNKFIIDKVNSLFSRTFKYKKHKLNFNNQKLIANANAENIDKSIEITFDKSLAEIIKKVAQNIEYGNFVGYNDIVVLCRTNKEVLKAYYQLKRENIPVQLYLSKSIYKSKVIVDILKLLNYIAGGSKLEKAELFYTDLYVSANAHHITEQEFYDRVDSSIKTFKQEGILPAISQNLDNCYLLEYYAKTKNKQALANIQRFYEILRDLQNENLTSMEILNYLNVMVITGQEENQPQTNQENSVTISTIHTFKGLDSNVIIVNEVDNNLNKNQFADFYYTESEGLSFNKDTIVPNANLEKDINFETSKKQIIIDNLEEELRLMYVMLTRARNKVVLNSRKTLEKVKYQSAQNNEYVSYLRWFYNI
ncbi:MAG: ATP-dependent helicase [Clostridia bacterium]|nr:ATP-dependent helicase [Clostridia bacterium]